MRLDSFLLVTPRFNSPPFDLLPRVAPLRNRSRSTNKIGTYNSFFQSIEAVGYVVFTLLIASSLVTPQALILNPFFFGSQTQNK